MNEQNDLYWNKQVVLITGGSGIIGSAFVAHFATLGCKVAFTYFRNETSATALENKINLRTVRSYQADLSAEQDVERLVSAVESDLGQVTILINNAGSVTRNLLVSMSADEWYSTLNSHLTACFFCCRRVLKNMMKAKFGRIINISSVAGLTGSPGIAHYSAAKAGIIGLTKTLAHEVGTKGITCNSLVLGLIESENGENVRLKKEIYESVVSAKALKRSGRPHELLHAIEYMSGEHSGFMTGQSVILDGGYV